MEINVHLGGRPGIDCGGFCEFCFYKKVNFKELESLNFGCRFCSPNQIGCNRCREPIERVINVFKPVLNVLSDIETKIVAQKLYNPLLDQDFKINISGGADVFYYPHLKELVSILKNSKLPIHLGYTSGKGIKNYKIAEYLISKGVVEISFSVFSTDPEMRRKWMNDKTPEESLKALQIFCEMIDVKASCVVIPGINDQDKIMETCIALENLGVKSIEFRRFANYNDQGLILCDKKPVMEGIKPHSFEEFQKIVKKISDEFSFKVVGYPFYDPKNDFPFAILKRRNRGYLQELPKIKADATIITSKLAEPFLNKFFTLIDASHQINIISLEKDIADLITHEDFISINLDYVQKKVIIPSGALIHDKLLKSFFNSDGRKRTVIRGPYALTHPYFNDNPYYSEELLKFELESFSNLIEIINN
jgi:methanogenesis marker radical SAM protein